MCEHFELRARRNQDIHVLRKYIATYITNEKFRRKNFRTNFENFENTVEPRFFELSGDQQNSSKNRGFEKSKYLKKSGENHKKHKINVLQRIR